MKTKKKRKLRSYSIQGSFGCSFEAFVVAHESRQAVRLVQKLLQQRGLSFTHGPLDVYSTDNEVEITDVDLD